MIDASECEQDDDSDERQSFEPAQREYRENAETALDMAEHNANAAATILLSKGIKGGSEALFKHLLEATAMVHCAKTDMAYLPEHKRIAERVSLVEVRIEALSDRFVETCLIRW